MEIEEIIIIEIIIGPITEIDQEADGTIIGQLIGVTITRITIDKVMPDPITDKMPNGYLETEVIVEIELKIIIMTIQEVEVETDMITDLYNQDKAHYLMEEMNLGLDLTPRVSTNHDHVRCYRCRECDHFASECPNIPTDEEPDYDDADPASLQMLTQKYYPIDSEGEVEYLNL